MMTATTPLRSSTVDACSQRATKRANAHQCHTRSVRSSSCAEGGFFPSPICISTRLATQARRTPEVSHPLSGRCCRILSAIRPATLWLSAFNSTCHQTGAQPVQLRHAVLGLSAKRPSPSSASSHPPGSAWLSVLTRGSNHVAFTTAFTAAADWTSLAVETASPRSLVYRSLRRVIKTVRLSLSCRFDVRSLPWLPVMTSFNENPPSLRRLHRCPRS